MGSAGLDLRRGVEAGLLRVWSVRSAELGLDNHLAMVSRLIAEHAPDVAVVDGIGSLLVGYSRGEVSLMLARKFYLFKEELITTLATVLAEQDVETAMGVSSRADTWLLLRSVESNGKRSRLLSVLKSRGSAHSDQVREFALTDHGAELSDVSVGRWRGDDRVRPARADRPGAPRPTRRGTGRVGAGRGPRRARGSQGPGVPAGRERSAPGRSRRGR